MTILISKISFLIFVVFCLFNCCSLFFTMIVPKFVVVIPYLTPYNAYDSKSSNDGKLDKSYHDYELKLIILVLNNSLLNLHFKPSH